MSNLRLRVGVAQKAERAAIKSKEAHHQYRRRDRIVLEREGTESNRDKLQEPPEVDEVAQTFKCHRTFEGAHGNNNNKKTGGKRRDSSLIWRKQLGRTAVRKKKQGAGKSSSGQAGKCPGVVKVRIPQEDGR